MFLTNNKLIENISNEFNITDAEANNIINKLFEKIEESLINNKKFYIDGIGIICIDKNKNIILENEDNIFDESLESVNVSNNNIKNIFLEKSIYKSIFKNIKDISKKENIYIENFGTFYNSDIIFEADENLKNNIKLNSNNEIYEDILDELDNKIQINRTYSNDDEKIEEIIDDNTDDDPIMNILKDKSYNSIDVGKIIKNLNKKEEINNDKDKKSIEDNYPEMKEYTNEELLNINNFSKEDLEIHSIINESSYTNSDKLINNKNDDYKYNEKQEYNNELLNSDKKYDKYKSDNKNIKKEKHNNKSELFKGIIIISIIILFILLIGLFTSIYYNSNNQNLNNNIENKKLYDIVNNYFNKIESVNLSYITSKDMYYWDIAGILYGDSTYWPLIYAYNNDKYKIGSIIEKGSRILYRNIPDFYSVNDMKYLDNTISKSYIYIYPILTNDNKFNHASWALKLSAYYDINVFKNNSNMIPKKEYELILKNNNTIKNTYNDIIKYGKLNENIILSFIESLKVKLGLTK